jgi:hypothetical protein
VLARESYDTAEGCPEPSVNWNDPTCDVMSCGGTCWLTPNVCGTCGDPSGSDLC